MTDLRDPLQPLRDTLQPLLDAEQRSPGPTPDAIDALWARIAADHQRGAFPALDVPPPARPRLPYLWLALGLLAAGLLAAGLHLLRSTEPSSPETDGSITAPTDITDPHPTAIDPLDPPPSHPTASDPLDTPPSHPTASDPLDTPPSHPTASDPLVTPPSHPTAPPIVTPPTDPTATPAGPSRHAKLPTKPGTADKPRPDRPASTSAEIDTFAAELRLLAKGQAALSRDDYAEALAIADRYLQLYPRGQFIEDRDALRVLALCGSLASKSKSAAARFLRAYPQSIHTSRIHEACDLPAD